MGGVGGAHICISPANDPPAPPNTTPGPPPPPPCTTAGALCTCCTLLCTLCTLLKGKEMICRAAQYVKQVGLDPPTALLHCNGPCFRRYRPEWQMHQLHHDTTSAPIAGLAAPVHWHWQWGRQVTMRSTYPTSNFGQLETSPYMHKHMHQSGRCTNCTNVCHHCTNCRTSCTTAPVESHWALNLAPQTLVRLVDIIHMLYAMHIMHAPIAPHCHQCTNCRTNCTSAPPVGEASHYALNPQTLVSWEEVRLISVRYTKQAQSGRCTNCTTTLPPVHQLQD